MWVSLQVGAEVSLSIRPIHVYVLVSNLLLVSDALNWSGVSFFNGFTLPPSYLSVETCHIFFEKPVKFDTNVY